MTLSIKSTESKNDLRAELVDLEERINDKIRKITWTNQKLPYDRLAKGRLIKETVLHAIDCLDKGENTKLNLVLDRIEELGVKLDNR
jgi:hypothetical protein